VRKKITTRTSSAKKFDRSSLPAQTAGVKNTLIITAHPSSAGFTHRIADTIKKSVPDAEIVNLCAPEWTLPFLKFESPREMPTSPVRDALQKKITAADELVFIFPVWSGAEPAVLKNFYDTVFHARFAFRFTTNGAVGLLHGKTARFFCTCDGPGFLYGMPIAPLRVTWQWLRMKICGIRTKNFTVISKMRTRDETARTKILEKITRQVR